MMTSLQHLLIVWIIITNNNKNCHNGFNSYQHFLCVPLFLQLFDQNIDLYKIQLIFKNCFVKYLQIMNSLNACKHDSTLYTKFMSTKMSFFTAIYSTNTLFDNNLINLFLVLFLTENDINRDFN